MKVWTGYKDAEEAVMTIKKIMQTSGKLPDVLVDSYRRTLSNGYHGITQRFYSRLAEECPEALVYFSDVRKDE